MPRRASATLWLALSLACTQATPPAGPVPLAMVPSHGSGLAPLRVVIMGRDFEARVRTDFGGSTGSVESGFAARLEPASGGDAVGLQDVLLTEARSLEATLPGGLPRGLYRLVVVDPRGRTGGLDQAFRVVASAETVTTFAVEVLEPPRAGIAFGISLAALDAQGTVVEGFQGSVALSDLTGSVTPSSLGPFVLGRYQGQVVVPGLAGADRLTVGDTLGHTGSSAPFDVLAGPPMALAFADPPPTVAVGACSPAVPLELRDALGNPALAEASVTAALQSSPPGLPFYSDPACATPATAAVVPAGASRTVFHFRGSAAGPVTLRAVPASLPSVTQTGVLSP